MATFKGIVTAVSQMQSGTSKAGKAWQKIDVVLTYDNSKPEYPKAIVFSVMNDNINKFSFQVGGEYEVEVDFSTREYNGRTYMSASAWKATPTAQPAPAPANDPYAAMGMQPRQTAPAPKDDMGEPLPF